MDAADTVLEWEPEPDGDYAGSEVLFIAQGEVVRGDKQRVTTLSNIRLPQEEAKSRISAALSEF